MCRWCRTPEDHPPEQCHTMALLWNPKVAIVDGLESRTGKIPVKNEALCSRKNCQKKHARGSDKCSTHLKDVLQKRRRKAEKRGEAA